MSDSIADKVSNWNDLYRNAGGENPERPLDLNEINAALKSAPSPNASPSDVVDHLLASVRLAERCEPIPDVNYNPAPASFDPEKAYIDHPKWDAINAQAQESWKRFCAEPELVKLLDTAPYLRDVNINATAHDIDKKLSQGDYHLPRTYLSGAADFIKQNASKIASSTSMETSAKTFEAKTFWEKTAGSAVAAIDKTKAVLEGVTKARTQ